MLDLNSIDLEEIATALAGQDDCEHHWLINPDTGQIAYWTSDTGIDGQTRPIAFLLPGQIPLCPEESADAER